MIIYQTLKYPEYHPISIADVRNWTNDPATRLQDVVDPNIKIAIAGAVDDFEKETNRKFVRQRIEWRPERNEIDGCYFGWFGYWRRSDAMAVPFGQTDQDTVEIEYVDSDGNPQTFTDFEIVKKDESNSYIVLARGAAWPSDVDTETPWPVKIRFDAGWPFGPRWEAGKTYSIGDIMIPTVLNQKGVAYKCTNAGTSGGAEPTLTTEVGATGTDGTVTWECIGQTVPGGIIPSLLSRATTRLKTQYEFLIYPNINEIAQAWNPEPWRLRW